MNVKIDSSKLKKRLEIFNKELNRNIENTLTTEIKKVVEISKPLTPVDTGELVNSSLIENTSIKNVIEVSAVWDCDHALKVHSDLDWWATHNHPGGGQPYFAYEPFRKQKPEIIEKINKTIKKTATQS